jgi:hypothetical protein
MLIALFAAAAAASASPISADHIKADVQTLSSDSFLGRGPGEPSEAKAIAYIAQQFKAAGLEPGGEHGGWYQDAPLVRLDRRHGATLVIQAGGWRRPLRLGLDATLALRNPGETKLASAPLMFAGYGVVDPKLGWDAYAGVDMRKL